MELIKCQCNRVILFLTPEDMEKYHIDREKDDSVAKNVRAMLRDADKSTDFSGWCRILVKIFESKEGGCELFITRLGDQVSLCDGSLYRRTEYIYKFQSIEGLLPACKAINSSGFDGESRIYYEKEKPGVYLIIDREYENLQEFGAVVCRRSALLYIEEHCTRLSKGTVGTLSGLV